MGSLPASPRPLPGLRLATPLCAAPARIEAEQERIAIGGFFGEGP